MTERPSSPESWPDRTALFVSSSFADTRGRAYWLSRSPEERLRRVEELRRMVYGDRAGGGMQKVLKIARLGKS